LTRDAGKTGLRVGKAEARDFAVQMSAPPAGSYVIYNRVLSPTGDKLAITFGGQGKNLTVTPLTNASTQIWQIGSGTGTQTVVPASNTGLQVGWGNPGPVPLTPGGYVWTIRTGDNGYTIQDGGKTASWNLPSATGNSDVAITPGDQATNEKYRWIFASV
jgi:hypothetical protein